MSLAAKIRRAPGRIATGAFILNSGLGKLKAEEETAKQLHGMASNAYPPLQKVPPAPFAKALAIGEIAIGGAVLVPFVPAALAGLALTGFSGALLGMWWRTPGMHEENSPRPTPQGTGIAKDVWMFATGVSLLLDAALTESPVTGDQARADTKATIKADAKAAKRATQRAAKRARKGAESLLPG
jgi:uncharacterized membrane protein YphA (DoxX/SURF4 family)